VANEVDTLAGYVMTRIGRVPVRGELVPGPGPFELEILDADPRRLKKLRIYRGLDRANGKQAAAQEPAEPHPAQPSSYSPLSASDLARGLPSPNAPPLKSARRP
jgi:hypothetical protein